MPIMFCITILFLLIIFLVYVIVSIIKSKENKSEINELDEKIDKMSIEEYNDYIRNEKQKEYNYACEILNKHLDEIYNNYIKKCKRNSDYISNKFYIHKNDYWFCSSDFFLKFFLKDTLIRNYKIEYICCEYGSDMLSIEKMI